MPRPRKADVEEVQPTPSLDDIISEKINEFQNSFDHIDFMLLSEAWCNYLYSRPDATAPISGTDVMRMQAIWDRHIGTRMESPNHHMSAIALDIRATLIDATKLQMKAPKDNG
jgi:hypothetical protein